LTAENWILEFWAASFGWFLGVNTRNSMPQENISQILNNRYREFELAHDENITLRQAF
jgi:hypothetical protein